MEGAAWKILLGPICWSSGGEVGVVSGASLVRGCSLNWTLRICTLLCVFSMSIKVYLFKNGGDEGRKKGEKMSKEERNVNVKESR